MAVLALGERLLVFGSSGIRLRPKISPQGVSLRRASQPEKDHASNEYGVMVDSIILATASDAARMLEPINQGLNLFEIYQVMPRHLDRTAQLDRPEWSRLARGIRARRDRPSTKRIS